MKAISQFTSLHKEPEDPNAFLKKLKKDCFYKARSQYEGKKPFPVYWYERTGHLKTVGDWSSAKSTADQEEARGKLWFKEFIGCLKVQPWQK